MIELLSRNKKTLILAAGTGLVLLLVPLYFAEAFSIFEWCDCQLLEALNPVCWFKCIAQTILSLPIRIVFFVIVGILGIFGLLGGIFYAITAFLVNWLIGIIMSVGIVPGSNAPQIVTIGWEFSRQFANLFFILALAFIGLATVLRIKEYEAKKALPTLIIIALLINFTPVIVGFVVDMGNIVTKFFLEKTGNIEVFSDVWDAAWNYLSTSVVTIFTIDGEFFEKLPYIMAVLLTLCVYGTVLVIFFGVGIFVYILVGAVFLCRTVILWVLMILSPIAFLSKVFPDTRTTKMIFPDILHWDKWWQKLIQWTVIGIPISFFLYLSNLILLYSDTIENKFGVDVMRASLESSTSTYAYAGLTAEQATELAAYQQPIVDLFAMILAPTIALVLLIMGVLISFKAAPEGAKGIMSFTRERGTQRIWRGVRAGIGAAAQSRQTYRAQIQAGATGRQAFRHTILQPIIQPLHTWGIRRGPTPPTASSTDDNTRASASTASSSTSASPTSRAEEVGGGEEATTEEITSTAPPVTPTSSRARRIAKKAGGTIWAGVKGYYTKAPKAGLWAATGILKAAESMATKRIDKELGKGKEAKKTINCPYCSEEIPENARFCPYCRERLE